MILFGHLGITAGIAKAFEITIRKNRRKEINIDYRFVLAGSILPDIIDKPLYLLHLTTNSRTIAHTLLFSLLLLIAGLFLYKKKRKGGVLILGICAVIHLILDGMWLFPQILFWPFIVQTFPVRSSADWLGGYMQYLLNHPFYLVSEFAGMLVLLCLVINASRQKQLRYFIREGKL